MKTVFNLIFKSIKKAAKWYFRMAAQNGYMLYTIGSNPVDYFYVNRKSSKETTNK